MFDHVTLAFQAAGGGGGGGGGGNQENFTRGSSAQMSSPFLFYNYTTVRIASTERTPFLNHCSEILRLKHYEKSGLLWK